MTAPNAQPLTSLDEWEDDVKARYPEANKPAFEATDPNKKKEEFRNYAANARPSVREFYRLNHTYQTYDFVKAKKQDFLKLNRRKMTVWEAAAGVTAVLIRSGPDDDWHEVTPGERVKIVVEG